MAGDAAVFRSRVAAIMHGVIEFHIESLVEILRKRAQRRGRTLHVRMANRAHRRLRRDELRQVTVNASRVSREFRRDGIVGSLMTRIAIDVGVSARRMQKSAVILRVSRQAVRRKNIRIPVGIFFIRRQRRNLSR